MKKLYTIILFLLFSTATKAQFVSISDTAFVSFLTAKYPSAMSGSLLDTTNTLIVNEDSLICRSLRIKDIYGLQYFDKLKYFNCYFNDLTSLPSLPKTLKHLDCSANQLSSLPALPDTLIYLDLSSNKFSSLPTLPNNLLYFDCSYNPLYSLPSLPNSIQELWCNGNGLTSLPTLPLSLKTLYCQSNDLTSLPSLPSSLSYLDCPNNKLSSLPSLPSSLWHLNCYRNQLVGLPVLPTSLKFLDLDYNKLTSLPSIPGNVYYLHVSNNKLTNLPSLPSSLTVLDCSYNSISVLPTLPVILDFMNCNSNRLINIPNIPAKLLYINCEDNPYLYCLPAYIQDTFQYFRVFLGTGISCIPKPIYTPMSTGISGTPAICSALGGCSIAYNILGNVHQDTSSSCLTDSFYNGNVSPGIKVKKFKNGILNQQTYTNSDGYYSFEADITDSIDIVIDTAGQPFVLSCPPSGKRSSRITMSDSVFYYQDFGVKCKGVDWGVNSIYGSFRKGFSRPVYINAGEFIQKYKLQCAKGTSGVVTTTINGAASYESPMSGALFPSSVSGATISYTIADFGAIDMNTAFNIYVKTDSTAVLGSDICIQTIATTSSTDINRSNDSLTFCGLVVNSFDPNNKLVYPSTTIGPNEWLTYTINFQNTGTDTAYQIIVRDTLDAYLNLNSFTYLASSHKPEVNLTGNAVAFNFKNINLLDSFHNEPKSHGWLQYKIKTVSTLPTYAKVSNNASIYFDENEPILTNTTVNINDPLSIRFKNTLSDFTIYPNPASSQITIETGEVGELKILDLLGSSLFYSKIITPNTPTKFNLPKLSPGLYIYQFSTDKGTSKTGKLHITEL